MENLDRLKLYLNIPLDDESQDDLLNLLLVESLEDAAEYCNRDFEWMEDNRTANNAAVKMAVVKYNRRGTEGMKSQSFAGSNESYVEGMTAEVKTQLNSIKRAKFL